MDKALNLEAERAAFELAAKYGRKDTFDFRIPGTSKVHKVECVIMEPSDVASFVAATERRATYTSAPEAAVQAGSKTAETRMDTGSHPLLAVGSAAPGELPPLPDPEAEMLDMLGRIHPYAMGSEDDTAEKRNERLRRAFCRQQPWPVPDQACIVWRADLMHMANDLTRFKAFFDSEKADRAQRAAVEPAPGEGIDGPVFSNLADTWSMKWTTGGDWEPAWEALIAHIDAKLQEARGSSRPKENA